MNTTASFLKANLAGMAVVREVENAVAASSKEQVALEYGFLPSRIKHILWIGTFYSDPQVAHAAAEAELPFSIVEILAKANNKAPKSRDRNADMLELITLVKGKDATTAKALAADRVRMWTEPELNDKSDIAHMHSEVEPDGKRRLVARLNDDLAAEVDQVLHRLATSIMKSEGIPYPVAYAKALVAKVLSTPTPAVSNEPLFSPMFLIGTDCRYFADGRIATAAGGLVDLASVVDKPLKNTGYAAVIARDEDNVPQVAALVAVERKTQGTRFANNFQRLIGVLETLVCACPSCNKTAAKCQFHHIQSWYLGGKTEQKNLIPLCSTDNGRNDDDPDKPPKNGRVERDPLTGRAGWRSTPSSPLEFNQHPLVRKGTRAYGELLYNFESN